MNLRQIEAFRAVMESGSMTAAARQLGISQPNVSRLIAQLEAVAQLRFFERRGGRLLPTDEGSAFYAEVERAALGLRRLQQAASDIRTFGQGRLRIATVPALGFGFLPRILPRFRREFPNVTISLQLRASPTIVQWAAAQQCDIGFASDVADLPGVLVDPFALLAGVCVVPDRHRLARAAVVHPRDLADEPFVSLTPDDAARRRIDAIFELAGVPRTLALETPYSSTLYALVAEGLGVSIANPISFRDFVGRGLAIRRFEPAVAFRAFRLVPEKRARSRLLDAFIGIAEEGLRDEIAFIESALD